MKTFMPLLMLISLKALAAPEPHYSVVVFEHGVDKARIKKMLPEAGVYSYDDWEGISRREVLPIKKQEQFFEKSGLPVENMDQFERDMFVRYLKNFDAKFCAKKYKIPQAKIAAAQKLLKAYD